MTAIVTVHAIIFIIDAIIINANATLIDYNAFKFIGTDELQKLLHFESLFMHIPPNSTLRLLLPTDDGDVVLAWQNEEIREWRRGSWRRGAEGRRS